MCYPIADIWRFCAITTSSVSMLLVGTWVWRCWYPNRIDLFSVSGWRVVVPTLLILELALCIINVPHLGLSWASSPTTALTDLPYFLCLIALTEELWFRGIWFEMWRGRPFMCIGVGSLLFGAIHIATSSSHPISAFFFGLVFAAARNRGASIGVLVIGHGLLDWVNATCMHWTPRFGPAINLTVIWLTCVAVTAILLLPGRPRIHAAEV